MTNLLDRPGVPPSFGVTPLVALAPALSRAEWMPDGANAELDELRAEHLRLLVIATAAGSAAVAARRRFEQEDADYHEALREQVTDPNAELTERTPADARVAELADLDERSRAAMEVLDRFVRRAVETIAERHDDWAGELEAREAEIAERIEERRRALAEAEAEAGQTVAYRIWLGRTAGRHHIFRDTEARFIEFPAVGADARGLQPIRPAGVAVESPLPPYEPTRIDTPAMSPESRAALLAARAARHNGDTTNPEQEDDDA